MAINYVLINAIVSNNKDVFLYEKSLAWLEQAGLIHKVRRASKPGIPLSVSRESGAFKVSMVDVGLLGAMSDLPPEAVVAGNRVFTEYKDTLFQGASMCACACSK